jgi:hypothetical protein
MKSKSLVITLALISQIVLFNFANAKCSTNGADELVINGNKYCVVNMTRVDNPGCGAPQGEFTLLDNSGMPSLSAVPACLSDPGTCNTIQFNGKTITLQTNTKTGYCSIQGFGQGKCIAPNTWTSTGCDISPRVAPTCPANTKFVRGYNGNFGCFKQMWKCSIGTFFMFDAKTRGTCLVN